MGTDSSGWRRPRRRTRQQSLRSLLRNRGVQRATLIVVLLLLAVYLFVWIRIFYFSTYWYSDVGINDRRADVLYGLGAPRETLTPGHGWRALADRSAPAWAYTSPSGSRIEVRFDPNVDRVASISCAQQEAEPGACPPLYAMGLGTSEDHLWRVFGTPDRQTIAGEVKSMAYDDIGVVFGLKRYTVYKITLQHDQGGGIGRVLLLARSLLPTFGR